MKVKMFGVALLALCAVLLVYWVVVPPVLANPPFTFTAPTAIALGPMAPGSTYPASSTGSLTGNNPTGYTVTGIDLKGTNTGFMVAPGPYVLGEKLLMGPAASPTNTADTVTTFLTTSAAGTDPVPFFINQAVGYTDAVATGYTITITFTVTKQ
ncbi:MAG: hypothetical protein HWN68_17710 [Desulfobacterales bacterium]|nr:hypothetical protein [Desulfobacterales bacterium]